MIRDFFKDPHHEEEFRKIKGLKEDNYVIVPSKEGLVVLDNIIMPLQNFRTDPIEYELCDYITAEEKTKNTIAHHK